MRPICSGVFGNRRGPPGHSALLEAEYVPEASLLWIQPHGLASLLPQFYQDHERLQLGTDALIDRFITDCPELYPRCRYNPLVEEELRDVYYSSLRGLSRSLRGDLELDVAEAWLSKLEEYFRRDRNDARIANQAYVHRRSQHLFRALAEVAHSNRSLRLSRALYNFFVRHASEISSVESSATLGQWCWALYRGVLQQVDRLECLRKVLRQRPDLPTRLLQHGRRGQLLASKLEMIAGSYGFGDVNGINERQRMFRRATWDDLSEVNHFVSSGIRSRSASRDRRLLAGSRLDELESDELALQHERLLMRPNGRGNQRLAQLSRGSRFGNRLNGAIDVVGLDRFAAMHDLDDALWDRAIDLDAYGDGMDI